MTDEGWVAASELGDWVYCERAWWFARRRLPTLAAPGLERGAARHDAVTRAAKQVERRRGFAIVLLVAGVALWWSARRRRREAGLPAGCIIAADSREQPGRTLAARSIRLCGRPDLLVRQGAAIIPVEVKTGRTPAQPHCGHVLQLLAYCMLVEEAFDVRPPHGLLRYPKREFRVEFDEAAEPSGRCARPWTKSGRRRRRPSSIGATASAGAAPPAASGGAARSASTCSPTATRTC